MSSRWWPTRPGRSRGPAEERIVIPGYASLHEFSRAQEAAVKEGLVGRFWTLVHWTNWRVVFPVPALAAGAGRARDARPSSAEGRPVQLLVTNFPTWELNHTVLAYAIGSTRPVTSSSLVYDPNDPAEPGRVTFDRPSAASRRAGFYDTEPGPIRAFRMYYWALL